MNRIKIFSLGLVLSFVGMVYAAGGYAQTTSQPSVQDQPSASCCLADADCCQEGAGCCAKHKSDQKNHSQQTPAAEGDKSKSCCASGCAKHKADGKKTAAESCASDHQKGANCCGEGSGAGCCAEDACPMADTL